MFRMDNITYTQVRMTLRSLNPAERMLRWPTQRRPKALYVLREVSHSNLYNPLISFWSFQDAFLFVWSFSVYTAKNDRSCSTSLLLVLIKFAFKGQASPSSCIATIMIAWMNNVYAAPSPQGDSFGACSILGDQRWAGDHGIDADFVSEEDCRC